MEHAGLSAEFARQVKIEQGEQKTHEPIPQQWLITLAKMSQQRSRGETPADETFEPGRNMVFRTKDGRTISAEETISVNRGNQFQLDITHDGNHIALLRYVDTGKTLSMGKTEVDEAYRGIGINTQLFTDMSTLHEEAKEIYATFDGTNTDAYIEGLEKGLSPIEAVRSTPAGKVREKTGWELDEQKSFLPEYSEEYGFHEPGDPEKDSGGVRVVYKKT